MYASRSWTEHLLSRGLLPRPSTYRASAPTIRSAITSSRALSKTQVQCRNIVHKARFSTRPQPPTISRQFRSIRLQSNKAPNGTNPTPNLGSPEPAPSLSQRLKKLSREYGWAAFGVYMALTALDFPFCFLAVRALGTDRIGHYEHVAVEWLKGVVRIVVPHFKKHDDPGAAHSSDVAEATAREGEFGLADEIADADAANKGADASLWTQLALAYAIHKSFIFIRVPITVSITPKVVKTLRSWGWNIGKRKPKSS